MSGSRLGGIKARNTNYERNGKDFYSKIGRIGGRNGNTGGFSDKKVGKDGLTGPERAKQAGRKGGLKSRRGDNFTNKWAVMVKEKTVAEFPRKTDAELYVKLKNLECYEIFDMSIFNQFIETR